MNDDDHKKELQPLLTCMAHKLLPDVHALAYAIQKDGYGSLITRCADSKALMSGDITGAMCRTIEFTVGTKAKLRELLKYLSTEYAHASVITTTLFNDDFRVCMYPDGESVMPGWYAGEAIRLSGLRSKGAISAELIHTAFDVLRYALVADSEVRVMALSIGDSVLHMKLCSPTVTIEVLPGGGLRLSNGEHSETHPPECINVASAIIVFMSGEAILGNE